jgi:copper chaperone
MEKFVYQVSGMTCGHCVASITEEVQEVSGVEDVSVDLETKLVTVSGTGVEDSAVRNAIVEAGYSVDEP